MNKRLPLLMALCCLIFANNSQACSAAHAQTARHEKNTRHYRSNVNKSLNYYSAARRQADKSTTISGTVKAVKRAYNQLARARANLERKIDDTKEFRRLSFERSECFKADTSTEATITIMQDGEMLETLAKEKKLLAKVDLRLKKAIKITQRMMKALGHYDSKIDGIWGKGTRAAVPKTAEYLRKFSSVKGQDEEIIQSAASTLFMLDKCLDDPDNCLVNLKHNGVKYRRRVFGVERLADLMLRMPTFKERVPAMVDSICLERNQAIDSASMRYTTDADFVGDVVQSLDRVCESLVARVATGKQSVRYSKRTVRSLERSMDRDFRWQLTPAITSPKPVKTPEVAAHEAKRTKQLWPPRGDIKFVLDDITIHSKATGNRDNLRLQGPHLRLSGGLKTGAAKTALTGTLFGKTVLVRIKDDYAVQIIGEDDIVKARLEAF